MIKLQGIEAHDASEVDPINTEEVRVVVLGVLFILVEPNPMPLGMFFRYHGDKTTPALDHWGTLLKGARSATDHIPVAKQRGATE